MNKMIRARVVSGIGVCVHNETAISKSPVMPINLRKLDRRF